MRVVRLCLLAVCLSACASPPMDPPALPDVARFVPPEVILPAPLPPEPPPVVQPAPPEPLVMVPPPEAVGTRGTARGRRGQSRTSLSTAPTSMLYTLAHGVQDRASALLRYPYRLGAVYLIVTAPQHATTLLLPPGLRLAAPPSLDPERFDVGFAEMGSEETRQEAIILRPVVAGLEATTPLLTKTGQLLLCRIRSQEQAATLAVTWEMPAAAGAVAAGKTPGGAPLHAPALNLARLHTQYAIEAGPRPVAWEPVEAYDDGNVTVIRWAESLRYTTAPALFALTPDGKKTLPLEYTTYAVPDHPERGEFYVARGLYPRLQLRDGQGGLVTIRRLPPVEPAYTEVRHGR